MLISTVPHTVVFIISAFCSTYFCADGSDIFSSAPFEPKKDISEYRNYGSAGTPPAVAKHYRSMRLYQTVEYNRLMREKYLLFDREMHIWDALELLNDLVDVSDPDLHAKANSLHAIQTAERMRSDGKPDWMQLVGLIHDLGKAMYVKGCDEEGTGQEQQWGMVGDTFVVGAALPSVLVHSEFNSLNPDMASDGYNNELGMYTEGIGLDNLMISWGHDEYLYQVLAHHADCKIPKEGLVMIRYHSLYAWHRDGAYRQFMDPKTDYKYLTWVKEFNPYDLYSKDESNELDMHAVKGYYLGLITKYLGDKPLKW